jgi:hypothetical protein
VAGCLIVFSGVVLYKVTYHLAQHDKGERYQTVDNSQNDDEDDALWINNVPGKLLQHDPKSAFETASTGIQMGLPTVQKVDEEEEEEEEGRKRE